MLSEILSDAQQPIRKRLDRPLDAHILVTFFDPKTETGKQILKIKDEYENYALDTDIPVDPALRDFIVFKGSIFDYEPNCEGAIAYMKLAEELIEKWENDYENVCTDFSINEEEQNKVSDKEPITFALNPFEDLKTGIYNKEAGVLCLPVKTMIQVKCYKIQCGMWHGNYRLTYKVIK